MGNTLTDVREKKFAKQCIDCYWGISNSEGACMYNISCYNCTNKLNGSCVCTLVSDENEETCKYYKDYKEFQK